MKVIIAGGRNYNKQHIVDATMKYITAKDGADITVTEVVCGCARGADTLGRNWAEAKEIPVKEFPASWKEHGKKAGVLRNVEMANYADALVAFWDGESRGTKHMIDTANKKGLKVFIRLTSDKRSCLRY